MYTPALILSTSLLCFATLAPAADPIPGSSPWEVRFIGNFLPGINEGIDGVRDKDGLGGEILILYHGACGSSPLGCIAGVGLFDDDRRGRINAPDTVATYDAQGGMVTGGVSYSLSPRLSLESRIDIRVGEGRITAKQSFSNGDFTVLGDYGTYLAAACTIGIYYAFPSNASIGFDVGYDRFRGSSDFANTDATVKGDGATAGASLGFRF
jgi:hypothetical protein